jgi:thiol:disulfide interchange protein
VGSRNRTPLLAWPRACGRLRIVAEDPVLKRITLIVFAALLSLAACKAPPPAPVSRNIYPDPPQARTDIAAALKTAASAHKRILLDFGGNWCGDCTVLDLYFHDAHNHDILESNFVLVHVNIGTMDANLDIAREYDVPVEKGVPALAVLNEKGELLYSQRGGEFESMRRIDPSAVTAFLEQWKPVCSATVVSC